jgi:putative ubiquitin-RnfH superfamily antitoxin RatB of RatAB toxin-antitoxin module
MTGSRKRCEVAYARGGRERILSLELACEATIAEALEAARREAEDEEVAWDSAPVGIFGVARTRTDVPADGDRIELYRPLKADPRERRRAAVRLRKSGIS